MIVKRTNLFRYRGTALTIFAALAIAWPAVGEDETESTGRIDVEVVDADGEPVVGATVVLCDQETGQPLARGARQTIAAAFQAGTMQHGLARATTDNQGRFEFTGLQAGTYRLIAQSWGDRSKPDGGEPIAGVLEVNSEILRLHGVAERVEVSVDATPDIVIRPLGSGVLRIDEEMPNDETLLLMSTAPAAADPVLGFVGWSGPMLRNLLGGNRMPRGKTTVYGLPAGKVYVVLFAADNNPGFGAGEAEVSPGKVTDLYVPIVAGWSDGHHDPPKRLAPLFDEVKSLVAAGSFSVRRLLADRDIDVRQEALIGSNTKLPQHLNTEVALPSGRKATVGDLPWTADSHGGGCRQRETLPGLSKSAPRTRPGGRHLGRTEPRPR
jgi:hypothetical protein